MIMGLRKERVIVSETRLGSATEPDAETGEADDVSDYSEEAEVPDVAGSADAADALEEDSAADDADVADELEDAEADELADAVAEIAEDEVAEDEVAEDEAPEDPAADALAEFERELRMLPGDWYVVHSYAGYENRVKTNLESRIQSLNMEDYI